MNSGLTLKKWVVVAFLVFMSPVFALSKSDGYFKSNSNVPQSVSEPKRIGYLVGSSWFSDFPDFLQQKGHTVSTIHTSDIPSGILEDLDVLIVSGLGVDDLSAVQSPIDSWVRGGGTLITIFRSTTAVMNQFGYVQPAVLDNDLYYPSTLGYGSGGNTVLVQNLLHPLAFRLPERWTCSGDPIGAFQVLHNLDTDLEIVASLGVDSNGDNVQDPVVATCSVDLGNWVAFFCDFDNFSPDSLDYPRVCSFSSGSEHTLEEETLLDNAIHIGESGMIAVPVNIQPYQLYNILNPLSGENIQVAIAGNNVDYNLDDIDVSTIRMAGISPIGVDYADVIDPSQSYSPDGLDSLTCDDFLLHEPDGIDDLLLTFDYSELFTALKSIYQTFEEGTCFPLIVSGCFDDGASGLRFMGIDTLKFQANPEQLHGMIQFVLESSSNQEATVVAQLSEGAPPQIDRIAFYLETDFPFTTELVPANEGGLLADWGISETPDPVRPGTKILFESPGLGTQFLPSGANGPLFRIRYTNVQIPNVSNFSGFLGKTVSPNYGYLTRYVEVDNTIYSHWQSFDVLPIASPTLPSPTDKHLPSYGTSLTVAPLSLAIPADFYTDGVNDEVEINQAIFQASQAGGGTIRLATGTYTLGAPIEMRSKINLVGNASGKGVAKDTSLVVKDQFNGNMEGIIDFTAVGNSSRNVIQNLNISGNRANQSSGVISGIHTGSDNRHYSSNQILIRRVGIFSCSQYGINFDKNTQHVILTNCTIGNNALDGVILDECRDFLITDCNANNNLRNGINVYAGSFFGEIKYTGGAFNKNSGLIVQRNSYQIYVHESNFDNNTRYGILVYQSYGNSLASNYCVFNGKSGIAATDSCTNLKISDNHISNSLEPGIMLSTLTNSQIRENRITQVSGHGIRLYRSSYNILHDNRIINPSQEQNNKRSGIQIDDDLVTFSKFNVIWNNYIVSDNAKKMAYGIYEKPTGNDYNLVLYNDIKGAVRSNVDISGSNSYSIGNRSLAVPTPKAKDYSTPPSEIMELIPIEPTPTVTPTPVPTNTPIPASM